ncbi:hypothetical protein ACJJTC_018201 [Scirpophaga incertulas]
MPILEEDPRAPRRHLFSDGQNIYENCYKSFTGLNKKYYLPKNTATEKANSTEKLLSIAENLSTDISTTVELDTQCIQPEASTSQHFNPAAAVIPDTTTKAHLSYLSWSNRIFQD